MAPSNTVELARKGDPKAIAALMNKSLGAKGVLATAMRYGNSLEITLQSQRALNQKTMVDIVQKGMRNLQVSAIDRVLIRSEQGNIPDWESEIFLNNSPSQVLKEGVPETVPANSPLNVTKSIISQAIQAPETKVSSPASAPQKYEIHSNSSSGIVLLPKLSQLNRSVQKYQDTIIRLTDDTGRDIICLCTLAELIRTLYAPTPAQQSIADAIHQCSSTNGDGEKIIRNVSILQPGQMWQKTQIRCILQIAFEMDGASNLAENLTTGSSPHEEDTLLEYTPSIATEETLLEYPKTQAEDGGDETIIESISPAQVKEYSGTKTEDELVLEAFQRQYGRLSESPREDETILEAIAPAKLKEYNSSPTSDDGDDLFASLGAAPMRLDTKLDTKLDTRVDSVGASSVMDSAPHQSVNRSVNQSVDRSDTDILFSDFVFDATNPPKTISDIDTISDPAVPPPPQDNLSFTLDDFRSDLLSLV